MTLISFFTVSVNVLCFHVTYRREKGPVSPSCWPIPAVLWCTNKNSKDCYKATMTYWQFQFVHFRYLGICHSAPCCNIAQVMLPSVSHDNKNMWGHFFFFFKKKHSSHSLRWRSGLEEIQAKKKLISWFTCATLQNSGGATSRVEHQKSGKAEAWEL